MTQGSQCSLDDICINTIRTLSMDAVQAANSGHPGAPMGMAAAAYTLWTRFLKHNPKNPQWQDRDRFVLSGGHASMLLYSLLHLTGYDLSLDDIKNFRQWGSKTPGHPEYGHTPGVETTTGPLGQGFANAVGMAMAERHLAARFNRPGYDIVDHFTYVMCGDGDLMEGVSAEAASLAGHLGLGKLICIYDDNEISIEGSTDIAFTENVGARFSAYQWQVIDVADGNDVAAISAAIQAARADGDRPSLIVAHTHIAFGSPNKQDTADAHGAPLGAEEICLTKKNLGCPENESFCVPDMAIGVFQKAIEAGQAAEAAWMEKLASFKKEYPAQAAELTNSMSGVLPAEWDADIPVFSGDPVATRGASGKVLNAVAGKVATLMGGSADLAPSNKTEIAASHDFQKGRYDGRNIRFGVREHAMGAILSGMALHKGIRPYGATFLVFADYMRPAIRMAALMKLPTLYIFTHDSIAVGEDGPTHQPVEHLASLRCIPGLTVIRPADANETAAAWRQAIQHKDGPVALILSRQKLPVLPAMACGKNCLGNGAYILSDCQGTPDMILIGTGAEVHLALGAQKVLADRNIPARVVNMPSWELFEKMPEDYKGSVFPSDGKPRLVVEAGSPMGWERYIGTHGGMVTMNGFGASAPGSTVLAKFGFTVDHVVQNALNLIKR
ncbi:MAG: transketolase [Desulfobacterales bacterium]|jgi:transketolase|nr:transketolase [Desulfobacterales bacterium]